MYQVDLSFFNEPEEASVNDSSLPREWFESVPLAWNMSYEEADEYARNYANMTLNLTNAINRKGCDGCTLDVRKMPDPYPHAYIASYEFMPGRGIDVWHFEECHEPLEVDYV